LGFHILFFASVLPSSKPSKYARDDQVRLLRLDAYKLIHGFLRICALIETGKCNTAACRMKTSISPAFEVAFTRNRGGEKRYEHAEALRDEFLRTNRSMPSSSGEQLLASIARAKELATQAPVAWQPLPDAAPAGQ
jgi:hypothetical protein